MEKLPVPKIDDLDLPDVVMGIYDWTVAWDHWTGRAWVIGDTPSRVDSIVELIGGLAARRQVDVEAVAPLDSADLDAYFDSTATPESYTAAVERIQAYIKMGEIFQANLSQRFSTTLVGTAWELYCRLRTINPAPFASYFDFGDGVIVSASPERFLFADGDGRVETRPIKGTRPRSPTAVQDDAYRDALVRSEKDAAEHVMIVDVLRNDLSRVCEYGSVQVPTLKVHEAHATVHHLVSTVTGRLREGVNAADLLHACFPGGSITGAPKIRAMEIIATLESVTRGVYCGAIGYISQTGAMDTSIAIRTCVVKDGRVYFSAGGGVVADSAPEDEYAETLVKARALMRACVSGSCSHFRDGTTATTAASLSGAGQPAPVPVARS